ncbi:MAG: signal peptidase I [Ruminococcaceae bacterium]|nr:signal peptidase I [Oscillospiraceae bacterium]
MTAAIRKVWSFLSNLLVVGAVVLALLLVGVRLIGLQVFTVLSGSMEPTYHVGSLIYVKKVDPFELKSGDVITFMLDEDTLATHRIVGVVPDESDPGTVRFRTKGDANEMEDGSLVHYKNVVGSPIFTIPGLGYVASYIQKPPGLYFTIAAAVVILMLAFLPDVLDAGEDKEKKPRPAKRKPSPNPKTSPAIRPLSPSSQPVEPAMGSLKLEDILNELN